MDKKTFFGVLFIIIIAIILIYKDLSYSREDNAISDVYMYHLSGSIIEKNNLSDEFILLLEYSERNRYFYNEKEKKCVDEITIKCSKATSFMGSSFEELEKGNEVIVKFRSYNLNENIVEAYSVCLKKW